MRRNFLITIAAAVSLSACATAESPQAAKSNQAMGCKMMAEGKSGMMPAGKMMMGEKANPSEKMMAANMGDCPMMGKAAAEAPPSPAKKDEHQEHHPK